MDKGLLISHFLFTILLISMNVHICMYKMYIFVQILIINSISYYIVKNNEIYIWLICVKKYPIDIQAWILVKSIFFS